MEQSRMPLLEAVKTFETADPAYFRIPAHRFQRGVNPRFLEAVESRYSAMISRRRRGWMTFIIRREPYGRRRNWRRSCTAPTGAGFW